MQPSYLSRYFSSNLQISQQDMETILIHYRSRPVEKDRFLLREGEICKHSFFVEKGLLRQFSIDDKGKEHIVMFAPENWFVSERDSVYFNKPSSYYVQAIEDSGIVHIDDHFMHLLAQKAPTFHDFNTRLLHNHIRHLQKRINMLLSAPAEDRYLQFIDMYPDILSRVPQSMVASYLGIAPESLSRVRKQLATKK